MQGMSGNIYTCIHIRVHIQIRRFQNLDIPRAGLGGAAHGGAAERGRRGAAERAAQTIGEHRHIFSRKKLLQEKRLLQKAIAAQRGKG